MGKLLDKTKERKLIHLSFALNGALTYASPDEIRERVEEVILKSKDRKFHGGGD